MESIKLICQKCQKEDQKSKFHVNSRITEISENKKYYDEDGKWHWHHTSAEKANLTCDRKHIFSVVVTKNNKCSTCQRKESTDVKMTEGHISLIKCVY